MFRTIRHEALQHHQEHFRAVRAQVVFMVDMVFAYVQAPVVFAAAQCV